MMKKNTRKLKNSLAFIFAMAVSVGAGSAFLKHENQSAVKVVEDKGYAVTAADTGILWGDRHGCDLSTSGTAFVAKGEKDNVVTGVVCRPFFGSSRMKMN